MNGSFQSKSLILLAALSGAMWMAGCAANQSNSNGNPSAMGATPSPAADQKTDSALHSGSAGTTDSK